MSQHNRRDPTPFERRVYDATSSIPAGRVSTYGMVAAHIGCGSAQAVGQALRRNPFAPSVPCHRVISADLSIGGFSGEKKGERIVAKKRLLEEEGVTFHDGRLASSSMLFTFPATR